MSSITDALSADHARCDDLFSDAEKQVSEQHWDQATQAFEDFHTAIERHFSFEEQRLFPEFEQRTGQTMGPTMMMRSEHTQMRELLEDMAQSVADHDADSYLGQSETLLVVMQQHNLKEQQMLYPMTDQVLGGDATTMVGEIHAALSGTAS
jgi:iron-sulfur cluster repair protein YtfE (RIC family)